MSEPTFTAAGEMEPVLPPAVAAPLARLRAMTTPYFDSETADEAEQALRMAIVAHLNPEALAAVRAWFDAWSDGPAGMTREEAARLPEWDAMIDALGYDRDARRSVVRDTPRGAP